MAREAGTAVFRTAYAGLALEIITSSILESPVHCRTGKPEAARNYVRTQYDRALHLDFMKAYIDTQPNQRSGDVNVTPCDGTDSSEYWCCGNSTACCGDDASFGKEKVDRVFLGIISSSSMSSIASSTSTSMPLSSSSPSSTSTPSPTTTPPNDDSGGLSTGAKAGIGVGAAFGVIALLALGAFIGRRSYKKKKETAEMTTYYEPVKGELSSEYRHEAPTQDSFLHEAPVPQKPVELPGVPIRAQELPGSGR